MDKGYASASLIIRPAPQARALANKIKATGGTPFIFPTIEIIDPPDLPTTKQHLQHLARFDILIFCTANAVANTLRYTDELPVQLAQASTRILTIGPNTAEALTRRGIKVDAIPEHDYSSEGLLALPALQRVKGKRIAIIAGVDGRRLLQNTLTARDADVIKIETYARRCPANTISDKLQTWQRAGVDVIVGSSFLSLQNLHRLAVTKEEREWLLARQILVVSKRMHRQALALGFQRFLVAENATDEAILTELTRKNDR